MVVSLVAKEKVGCTSRVPEDQDADDDVSVNYHIARNIGRELNLADWQFWKQTAKLKSACQYKL